MSIWRFSKRVFMLLLWFVWSYAVMSLYVFMPFWWFIKWLYVYDCGYLFCIRIMFLYI